MNAKNLGLILIALTSITLSLCAKKSSGTAHSHLDFPCRNEFTYNGKKSFFRLSMDSVAELKYNKLDSSCFFKLLTGTSFQSYYSKDNFRNFLYNSQNMTDSIRTITLVLSVDHNYYLKYLTFDSMNHLIDSLDVAGFGGDGGFGFEGYGRFINDSVYQRYWINISNIEDPKTSDWISKRDTSISNHIVHKNGRIEKIEEKNPHNERK